MSKCTSNSSLPSCTSRFTDDDVDEMYREAPIKGSMFDYIEFTRILKHGAKDKDEQWKIYDRPFLLFAWLRRATRLNMVAIVKFEISLVFCISSINENNRKCRIYIIFFEQLPYL